MKWLVLWLLLLKLPLFIIVVNFYLLKYNIMEAPNSSQTTTK